MALASALQMVRYIKTNGHLRLEGDESTGELREALLYLRMHHYRHCHRPELGTPIVALVPDITELTGKLTGYTRVSKIDINSKYGKAL